MDSAGIPDQNPPAMAIDLRAALDAGDASRRARPATSSAPTSTAPGGPRGQVDKADADTEAEWLIRGWLLGAFLGWGFLGEETGHVPAHPGEPMWLVDPNDGTRDYLKGRRGSAVSIALLRRRGAAARRRLRVRLSRTTRGTSSPGPRAAVRSRGTAGRSSRPRPDGLGTLDVVLVSSAGDSDPAGNLACVTPARFRAVPSIAHRLALVAAGEAAAAVSLNWPSAWDYAAGHALLRGAGATLLDEQGREVAYGPDGREPLRLRLRGPGGGRSVPCRHGRGTRSG